MLALFLFVIGTCAQSEISTDLSRHDFFYAGQSKKLRMFIVKDGKVRWQYYNKKDRGEISDAVLLRDGHILIAHQYGIAEVTQDDKTICLESARYGSQPQVREEEQPCRSHW